MHWFAPFLDAEMVAMKRATDGVLRWLPTTSFRLVRFVCPKAQHLPFDRCGSHEECYKHGNLCKSFLTPLGALSDGEGFWYACEGSAPIDFILVIKLASTITWEPWTTAFFQLQLVGL